ncbi:hypothetical protein [Zobellella sp. DQSA1]|uniref:hypothetical protein n=1 Tax=Zobellella sp. DQSA1 TaxID=3342386 RepID=UPI0035C0FCD7
MSIARYLQSRYRDGGRGPWVYDCWGLVRAGRHELYGLPLLPSYGAIDPDDKPGLTRAARAVMRAGFRPVAPAPGAIATCWRGRLCLHVGLVIEIEGRLEALETNRSTGPRRQRLADFEANHLQVVYYDDRDLPQHPTG